jgi:hypothetical protein
MKFRTGLVIGFGVGYVLGARAGRERYEQLRRGAAAIAASPQLRAAARVANRRTESARAAAGNGLIAASEKVRRAAQ